MMQNSNISLSTLGEPTGVEDGFFYIPYDFLAKVQTSSVGYIAFIDQPGAVLPDLTIGNFALPAQLSAGQQFQVLYVVRNAGQTGTSVFFVRWYISKDNIIDSSDIVLDSEGWQLPGLSRTPDSKKILTLPIGTDPFWQGNGTYYLCMKVDADDTVKESDEGNNAAAVAIPIDVPAVPFEVSSVKITHVGKEYNCQSVAIPNSFHYRCA